VNFVPCDKQDATHVIVLSEMPFALLAVGDERIGEQTVEYLREVSE
jgi:hypothetical protein